MNVYQKLKIPDYYSEEHNTLSCPKCGYENSLLPAPLWMKKITVKQRSPVLIIGGEDEEYEKNF